MAHRPAGEVALISVKPEYAERILAGSKRVGGIGADRYWAYYRGAPGAVAIGIASVQRLADGLTLRDLGIDGPPPQSYRYVDRARGAVADRSCWQLSAPALQQNAVSESVRAESWLPPAR